MDYTYHRSRKSSAKYKYEVYDAVLRNTTKLAHECVNDNLHVTWCEDSWIVSTRHYFELAIVHWGWLALEFDADEHAYITDRKINEAPERNGKQRPFLTKPLRS